MRRGPAAIVCVVTCFACSTVSSAAQAPRLAGHWEGTVGRGETSALIRLDVGRVGQIPQARFDAPSAGVLGWPVRVIAADTTVTQPQAGVPVRLELPNGWHFEGRLASVDRLAGTLHGGEASAPFVLTRRPEPRRPYRTADVVFRNGDVSLGGTIYLPLRGRAHPAVVFAHGSGPMDREADLFYADYLVRRGIVVLLYDKRGVGQSTGEWQGATLDELASDALAGVDLLRGRPEVDASRVGVAGRSQGGQLALLAAARAARVAFAINISGAAVRPWQQMNYQAEAELRRDAVPAEATREALAFMNQKWAVAATGRGWDSLAAVIGRARAAQRPWLRYVQVPDKLEDIRDSWETMNYDPDQTLAAVRQPVLGLFGEGDVSTPVRETVAAMRRGLARAGNRDVTIRVYPRADHALLVWPGGGRNLVLPRYPLGYPEVIALWILERTPRLEQRVPK
jgi:hypothetical protein